MHLDVLDLRNFYYRTQLGRAAQKALAAYRGEVETGQYPAPEHTY